MKKVGIFGGSFDPIHNGHIRLAQYVLDHTDLDEVWLMVSPLNPLKPQGYVATDEQRLEMARLAVADCPGIKVSDFEFSLPIPSYTYNTLKQLKQTYPDIDFRLIIGGDNWAHFDRWRNPKEILDEFGIIVYPRSGEEIKSPICVLRSPTPSESSTPSRKADSSELIINNSSLIILESAPQMPVSSTQLRTLLSQAGSSDSKVCPHSSCACNGQLSALLPPAVLAYIDRNRLYTQSSAPC